MLWVDYLVSARFRCHGTKLQGQSGWDTHFRAAPWGGSQDAARWECDFREA